MTSKLFQKQTLKYWVGGLVIVVVVTFLIAFAMRAGVQYFITVDELFANKDKYSGQQVRISGAVVGDSIRFNASSIQLTFTIAQVSGDQAEIEAMGGLAVALHQAVIDPTRSRVDVIYAGTRPDLLKDEAQAILTGSLDADGFFHAEEILLKCPSKYAEEIPQQVESTP